MGHVQDQDSDGQDRDQDRDNNPQDHTVKTLSRDETLSHNPFLTFSASKQNVAIYE